MTEEIRPEAGDLGAEENYDNHNDFVREIRGRESPRT